MASCRKFFKEIIMSWPEKINSLKADFKRDEHLSKYCSMGVGGPAQFFIEVKDILSLVDALETCRAVAAPYKVIGGGTNIIPSDQGFSGVVIKNKASSLNIDTNTGRVIVDSGVSLSGMIMEAANAGFGGLEALYGIPGTVGGSIVNNAGTHGVSISDFLKSATVFFGSEKINNCKTEWFKFGYRESKLKYQKEDFPPTILSAIFQFQRRKKDDVALELGKYKKWRIEKQPLGIKTCGSVFRNPSSGDVIHSLDDKKRSAGYLLEEAGAKKFFIGGARVSKKHANWIENFSGASAGDIRELVEKMRTAVEEKYQVILKEEIEYMGKWNGA